MLNDDATRNTKINKITEKSKLWKEWKQGNTNKEQYLEEKRRLGRLFTRPNVKQKGKDLETLCSDDQKYKFQFGKKEVPQKIYHKMLLNTVIWCRNSLPQTDTVSLPCLSKDQDMVRVSNEQDEEGCKFFKFNVSNGKSARETRLCIIIDLVNQIIVKRVIKVEWELSMFVKNCSLERANYRD